MENLKSSSNPDLVPLWSVSTWVYGAYPGSDNDQTGATPSFDMQAWMDSVTKTISAYNSEQKFPNSQINQVYPYASDIELPWSSLTNGPNTNACKNGSGTEVLCWYLSDPTDIRNAYGFYFLKTSGVTSEVNPPTPPQTIPSNPLPPTFAVSSLNLPLMSPVFDARIDNGYLMGFNEVIRQEDAENLASLIVNGGYSQQPVNSDKSIADFNYQVGVGAFGPSSQYKYTPTINGLQLDLEPFNPSIQNQAAFYNKIGALLAENGQYYSVFTYPKSIDSTTASVLNSSNNGVAIVALYDLVDMKCGIPESCTLDYNKTSGECDVSGTSAPVIATGDATTAVYDRTVPHTLEGYYNSALLSVKQTITKAAQTGIKYKFAIPLTSSVHEFESWGIYACSFSKDLKAIPTEGFCKMYNNIPNYTGSRAPSQIDYVIQAVRAIRDGISMMSDLFKENENYLLFRGIDLYSFGFRTIWTPQNPVIDWQSGNIYYGNTPEFVETANLLNPPYVFTSPSVPIFPALNGNINYSSPLGWLTTQNLDFRPCNETTCPTGECVNNVCQSKG